MKLKDFTRYADSMKEVATEPVSFSGDALETMRMQFDRMGSLQRVSSANVWSGSSPMLRELQDQQNSAMSARPREYTTGGLLSALGGFIRGL